jgi:triacylglycerol lipase
MPTKTFSFDRNDLNSLSNAYWMSRLSDLAYRHQDALRRETNVFWGKPSLHFFDNEQTDTQAYILEYTENDPLFIAFRGTESSRLRDWLTDASFLKKELHGFRVHGGFARAFDSILKTRRKPTNYSESKQPTQYFPTFIDTIDRLKGRPIILTGHSLGAALAAVGAIDLSHKDISISAIYTYGQPKIFNNNNEERNRFRDNVCADIFVSVNDKDIVPRVPPKRLKFKHFIINYPFDGIGNLITSQAQKDVFQSEVDEKGMKFIWKAKEGIGDHSTINYIRNWAAITGLR